MRIKIFYILFFICSQTNNLNAQSFQLKINGNEKDTFVSITHIPILFNSFTECDAALHSAINELYKAGYFTASIDSVQWKDSIASAFVMVGKKFQWASLKNKNIPINLISLSRFDEKEYFNKPIELKKVETIFEKIIRYFENNGYPFCYLQLDSITEIEGKVSANLFLERGPVVKIDTIDLNEDATISKNYILHYLGLKEGMLYDERKIKTISKKIHELSFQQESYPWKVYFSIVKTTLKLYLKNKSANQADVLIGLMPNNVETGGKFLVTGDVKLGLVNALNQGESIQINWQNLQYKSPRYDIKCQLPFMLNSPIGITGKFDFYKKDTTFKTINGQLGLLYQINSTDYTKFYYELASSRLDKINTATLLSTRTLPANADVSYKTVGIENVIQQVDYKLNPRKGYTIFINAGFSLRRLLKNSDIENTFDPQSGNYFSYLYDTMVLKNYKYQLQAKLQYFISLKKRVTIATIFNSGITYSTNPLFKNELFQIGGYRLLRGFDEGSLFVNNYQIFTIEPRYLLSSNSYFFLFTDIGYIKEKYNAINRQNVPYSFGLGMSFETKSGLFNISYAVGTMQNQGVQFKNSKIHFGYVNYF